MHIKSRQIPAMGYLGGVALPQLQKQGGPKRHKNGKEHGAGIVNQIGDFGIVAGFFQVPKVAPITEGTHCYIRISILADVFPGKYST